MQDNPPVEYYETGSLGLIKETRMDLHNWRGKKVVLCTDVIHYETIYNKKKTIPPSYEVNLIADYEGENLVLPLMIVFMYKL